MSRQTWRELEDAARGAEHRAALADDAGDSVVAMAEWARAARLWSQRTTSQARWAVGSTAVCSVCAMLTVALAVL